MPRPKGPQTTLPQQHEPNHDLGWDPQRRQKAYNDGDHPIRSRTTQLTRPPRASHQSSLNPKMIVLEMCP
ncbi:hypothetical protein L484_019166 [Morus notabilis]|uniref:Uncharacterized protein n=1 Tax=Morus notabilis TaxID=981085 RepID=W9QUC9_9ROSA|nr:hypothetical protein L484_019166 [Morus notabilis]